MIKKIVKYIKLKRLVLKGLVVGKNFNFEKGVIIDSSIPWLINIGDNVTLAPYVHILAHDASTKIFMGYSKIGKVEIGNNVFIGTKTVILPNVKIGDNVIIGAGAIVTKDIPSGKVVCGAPAVEIMETEDYINKHKKNMNLKNTFTRMDSVKDKKITNIQKEKMKNYLNKVIGYIN